MVISCLNVSLLLSRTTLSFSAIRVLNLVVPYKTTSVIFLLSAAAWPTPVIGQMATSVLLTVSELHSEETTELQAERLVCSWLQYSRRAGVRGGVVTLNARLCHWKSQIQSLESPVG